MKLFSEGSTQAPNPDPKDFTILTYRQFKSVKTITALEVNYPNCTVYKGNKILVYKMSVAEIKKRTTLDPHFLEDDTSPIARFPFTYEGWNDALAYAEEKSTDERKGRR